MLVNVCTYVYAYVCKYVCIYPGSIFGVTDQTGVT